MTKTRIAAIAGTALSLLLVLGTGSACTGGGDEPATSTEATATVPPPVEVISTDDEDTSPDTAAANPNEGLPIATPERGSADRTSLMDAARELTGSTRSFLVWQLFVQGDVAIGDIQEHLGDNETPGRRWLVVWERSGDGWNALLHQLFLDVMRTEARAANDTLTDEIVGRMEFMVPAEVPAEARVEASRAADHTGGMYGLDPYPVFAPSRLPEGMRFDSFEGWEGATVLHYAADDGRRLAIFMGWGDCDIWSDEYTSNRANWGDEDATYARATYTEDKSCIHRNAEASAEVDGTEVSEAVLRAVAMSMRLISP